jgi:single-stranded-DNA-specific exonuclease
LDRLEPTGLENRSAYFVSRNLLVKSKKTMGHESQHLRLVVSDGRITYDAVAFRMGHLAESLPARVDLFYSFERNFYNGRVSLQLMVRDLRPSAAP